MPSLPDFLSSLVFHLTCCCVVWCAHCLMQAKKVVKKVVKKSAKKVVKKVVKKPAKKVVKKAAPKKAASMKGGKSGAASATQKVFSKEGWLFQAASSLGKMVQN